VIKLSEWWRRFRFLLRRGRLADELDEELRLHLELRAQANRRLGMAAHEADLAARRAFGNPAVLREESRETWGWISADRLIQDLRYGGRQLLRHRTWTAAAILILALGIGANTSMFSALNAVLFRVPTGVEPQGLVWVTLVREQGPRPRMLSYPGYLASRTRTDVFSGVAAFDDVLLSLGDGAPERVRGTVVSGNYFEVLGVKMAVGRTFHPWEDTVAGVPVAVLSHSIWMRRYGADPGILDTFISINRHRFRVVGVTPPGFKGMGIGEAAPAVWIPMAMIEQVVPGFERERLTDPGWHWIRTIGRLAEGVSIARANLALRAFKWAPDPPNRNRASLGVTAAAGGLDPGERPEIASILGLLTIVPALVLLVACANAANLLLARGADRRRELALRRALGASRARLVRQLLVECLLLTTVAGAAGVFLAQLLTTIIGGAGQIPPGILDEFRVDGSVLLATLIVSIVSALGCGLIPALAATSPALAPALKEEGATLELGQRRHRLRDVLVVTQVMVSVVLLVVAGLFVGSLSKSLRVNPGFDVHRGATLSFDLALEGYAPAKIDAFLRELLDRAHATPGLESAALTTALPLGGRMFVTEVFRAGQGPAEDSVETFNASVTPGYFRTMKIPLTRGRDFTSGDSGTSAPVAIISEALAARLWANAEPIGQRIKLAGIDTGWRDVVGVTETGRYDSLTELPAAYVYLPLAQAPSPSLSLVARGRADPAGAITTLESVVRSLDPDLPIVDVRTFEQVISDSVDKQRAASALLAALGVLSLLLAALGIYGVMSHATTLRVQEIGIRMALGARPPDVKRLFAGETLRLCIVGFVLGAAVAAVVSKLIAGFLFGLAAADAAIFLAGGLIMCATAMLATYLPARRAARVNPLVALRG
jgi:predicted permease